MTMQSSLRFLLSIAFVLYGGAAFSQTGLENCAAIENELDRLACYDKASGRTPEVSETAAPKGDWKVRTEVSQLTDQTNVFLYVDSDETVNCGWNRGDKVTLWVRCVENKTAIIFRTGCHMTSSEYNNYGDVTYRVDDQKARTVGFTESTNNRSLGLWRGGRSIPEIKRLFGGKTLIARMTPYSENSFTATFNITGLEEAIGPLRKACHW